MTIKAFDGTSEDELGTKNPSNYPASSLYGATARRVPYGGKTHDYPQVIEKK
jgi:hypothetical protein